MMLEEIFNKERHRPYVIAEVSQNHDGSLGQAHAFVDAVAQTGADAIKFQTHIAEEESTVYEPFRINFSYEDKSRFDYWKRMEFTAEQWKELYVHATECGLEFLSSPFSIKALDMLDSIGVKAWKFGAGEVFDDELLTRAIETGKPLLLSTGLSTYSDIDRWVNKIRNNGNKYLLFQCVTAYPSTAEMIDINQITELQQRYGCRVGLSDHSATIYPALAATTLGASAIEVHVTLSKYMFGPDVKASVDIKQLKQIVEGVAFITEMKENHCDMEQRDKRRDELKQMFSKSLYAVNNILKGTEIKRELFQTKKPNMGITAEEIEIYIGKKIIRNIKAGEPLRLEDIE